MVKRTANRKELRKIADAVETNSKDPKAAAVRKKKVGSRRSKSANAERKRIVWVIFNGAQKEEARFAYSEHQEAEEKLAQLMAKSSKKMFYIQPVKESLSTAAVPLKTKESEEVMEEELEEAAASEEE
jgi:hypothetical protein